MSQFGDTGGPIESLIPRLVRNYLAADATLAAYFGTSNIRVHGSDRIGPVRAPHIQVSPGDWSDKRTLGNSAVIDRISAHIRIYLPVDSGACDSTITIPAAPTISAPATAGPLTGTYKYALSTVTDTGESYLSPLSAGVAVTAKKITVPIPTGSGAVWRRLWRTETGRTCPRILSYCINDGVTSYIDETPDAGLGDEIGPEQLLSTELGSYVKQVIYTNQALANTLGGSLQITDCVTHVDEKEDVIDVKRGQIVKHVIAWYGTIYDVTTRRSSVE